MVFRAHVSFPSFLSWCLQSIICVAYCDILVKFDRRLNVEGTTYTLLQKTNNSASNTVSIKNLEGTIDHQKFKAFTFLNNLNAQWGNITENCTCLLSEILDYWSLLSGRQVPAFWRTFLPPSSGFSWINSKMESSSSCEMLVPVYLLRRQHHYDKLSYYMFTVLTSDPESCTMPYIAFVIYCSISDGELKWSWIIYIFCISDGHFQKLESKIRIKRFKIIAVFF